MIRASQHSPQPRVGSTLTEVLISVMVIGIGMVSVMTLFPLSVVRAVKANQLTQSTILRYNAEEKIETLQFNSYWPWVVERGSFGNVGNTPWTNNNHYPGNVGDDNGNIDRDASGWLPGPDGVYGVPGVDTTPGYSDNTPNNVSDDIPILDQDEVRFAGRDVSLLVIDPLGWWEVGDIGADDAAKLNLRNHFGNTGPVGVPVIPRLNGGFRNNNTYSTTNPRVRPTFIGFYENPPGSGTYTNFSIPDAVANPSPHANDGNLDFGGWGFNRVDAQRIATLPDQYSTLLDVVYPDTGAIGSIPPRDFLDLPNTLPINVLHDPIEIILSGLEVQATFFGIEGTATRNKRVIYSRTLLHEDLNSNGTLDPGEDIDNDQPTPVLDAMSDTSRRMKWRSDQRLPANFQIERITLQTQLVDFTWMVTARLPTRPPTRPQMDVVVFHKRRFETIDEEPYTATRVSPTNRKVYTIDYGASGQNKPWARKGSYMFDMEHGYWFLITDLTESGTTLTVTLERDVRDTPFGPADDVNQIVACFPRGIVDVFPLGAK